MAPPDARSMFDLTGKLALVTGCRRGIAPGYIETDNTIALRNDPDRYRSLLERIPAGRGGQPDDLAGVTVFLASAAADYVCGAIIPVDGGWLAR